MKSKVSSWFETTITYEKTMDDGLQKITRETYVVEAINFTEAENKIIEEMSAYISGEFKVSKIAKAPFKEVFFSEDPRDDRWFKVKVQLITLDEKSSKEKSTSITYLIQGSTLQTAIRYAQDIMNTGVQDWRLGSATETTHLDVFELKPSTDEDRRI